MPRVRLLTVDEMSLLIPFNKFVIFPVLCSGVARAPQTPWPRGARATEEDEWRGKPGCRRDPLGHGPKQCARGTQKIIATLLVCVGGTYIDDFWWNWYSIFISFIHWMKSRFNVSWNYIFMSLFKSILNYQFLINHFSQFYYILFFSGKCFPIAILHI